MRDLLITFLASFLIWFMLIGLLILWRVHGKIGRQQVTHVLIASFIAWLVSVIIKGIFPSLRPFEISGALPLTLTVPLGSAFPSSHTSCAFALALSVQKYSKRIGYLYLFFAVLVGFGRVLGNVHYYIDIIGGAIVGNFSVFFLENFKKNEVS